MKAYFLKFIFLFVATSFFFYSCDSTNSGSEEPPELPPAESMQVDVSEMQSAEKQVSAKAAESNFTTALFATGIAKVILDANLAIPRALLEAAENHSAENLEDGEWEWSYTSSAGGNTFGANLVASVESDEEVTWDFYVTNSALDLEDQLFFSGTSNFEATEGTWAYYDLQSGEEVSFLNWERTDNTASVNLEVTSDRNGNLGDTINYDFDGTVKTVAFYDASDTETTTISYNTETKAGFIISPNYNDGEKSCWDEDFNNVTCPAVAVP